MRYAYVVGVFLQGVSALNAINVSGQDLVDSVTGDRFEVIGVDYQPGGSSNYDPNSGADPLSNADNCRRDAALLQKLGANTIRSYNLNPDTNHDDCASIFNAAGIYMILDVNSPLPGQSINRADPASTYNSAYLGRVFKLLDNFRGYPNTLGFFGANELINDDKTSMTDPPYIRAVQRDIKQYMKARGGRVIPVGYSAADVRDILEDTTNYVSCHMSGESDDVSRSDFFGVNGYSWCADATFTSSHYDQLAQIYSNTTIPVLFSEYGCNQPEPRLFNEVGSIYSATQMPTFSGGLVYEWTQEPDNYGLVNINDNSTVSLLNDYMTLQSKYATIDRKFTSSHNNTATSLKSPDCSASLISGTSFTSNFTLPAQPNDVATLIKNGAGGTVTGKLVAVNDLSVHATVYYPNGTQVQNLAVTRVSSSDSTGTASSSATSSTAAAANVAASHALGFGAFTGSMLWLLGML